MAPTSRALTQTAISDKGTVFDVFTKGIDDHFLNAKSSNMKELKNIKDANRRKGLIFEEICIELLKEGALFDKCGLVSVWSFRDLTDEQLMHLNFMKANGNANRQDVGIDIVAVDSKGRWYAIQCKYLQKPLKQRYTPNGKPIRWAVPWTALSTFYGLAARTGPANIKEGWHKLIVMTNSDGIKQKGKMKTEKEVTIAHGTFSSIDRSFWQSICGYTAYTLSSSIFVAAKEEKNIALEKEKDSIVEKEKDGIVVEEKDSIVVEEKDSIVVEEKDSIVKKGKDGIVAEEKDSIVEEKNETMLEEMFNIVEREKDAVTEEEKNIVVVVKKNKSAVIKKNVTRKKSKQEKINETVREKRLAWMSRNFGTENKPDPTI